MNKWFSRFIFLTIVGFSQTQAQVTVNIGAVNLHAGKIGLGIDGITGSTNLLMKYFFNNQLAGQLIAGFELETVGGSAPQGQTKQTGHAWRAGGSLVFHLTRDQVSPYLGIEGIFESRQQKGFFSVVPDPQNKITGGIVAGAEYFANDQFSFGVKQLLGLDVMLERHANSLVYPREETTIRFTTSTLVTARYYFN